MTWPLLPNAATHTADVGLDDQLLAARCIRETIDWFLGKRAGLFDANFFFPHPGVFATTDPGFGIALMLLPFRVFTDDTFLLANLAILLTFPLTAHATYLLVRDLTHSRAAGLLAGAAFGFCLYRAHQLDHVSILQMQWFVYSLVYLHRIHRSQRWVDGAMFALFFFLNAIGSSSIALFTFAAYPIIGAWALATVSRSARARFVVVLGVSGFAAVALIAPIYLRFIEAHAIWGMERSVGQAIHWSARVEQFHAAPPWSLFYGKAWAKFMGSESATFLGFGVLVLAATGVASPWAREASWPGQNGSAPLRRYVLVALGGAQMLAKAALFVALAYVALLSPWTLGVILAALVIHAGYSRRDRSSLSDHDHVHDWVFASTSAADPLHPATRAAALYLALGVLFAMFALGPLVIHSGKQLGSGIWTLITALPGFGSVRTPSRLFFITSMSAAILAGIGYAVVCARLTRGLARAVLFVVAFAVVVLESWIAPVPLRRIPTLAEAPPVYRWLAAQPGRAPVAELPVGHDERGRIRRAHMYFGNIHGRPTVDDVASFDMPVISWLGRANAVTGKLAVEIERLHAAGLEFIVLHRAQIPLQFHEAYLRGIDASGARRVAEFGPDLVWQLAKATVPRAFSAETIVAAIEVSPVVAGNGSIVVDVQMAPRGDFTVFEKGVRRLTLHGTIAIGEKTETFRKPIFLPPPLFAAAHRETYRAEFRVDPDIRGLKAPAMFWLTDATGETWASVATVFTFADKGTWEAEAARFPATPAKGACGITLIAKHRGPSGRTRLLFHVRNMGLVPWAGASAKSLQIAARGSSRATMTVPGVIDFLAEVSEPPPLPPPLTIAVPPLAAGAGTLLGAEVDGDLVLATVLLVGVSGGDACARIHVGETETRK